MPDKAFGVAAVNVAWVICKYSSCPAVCASRVESGGLGSSRVHLPTAGRCTRQQLRVILEMPTNVLLAAPPPPPAAEAERGQQAERAEQAAKDLEQAKQQLAEAQAAVQAASSAAAATTEAGAQAPDAR